VAALAGSRSTQRLHLAVGVFVVLVLPLASWIDGSGQLAWTMFSRTGQYRLDLRADDVPVNPTELAAAAAPGSTAMALAGSDHFRHHDVMRATMRRHLDDIAHLACRTRPAVTVVASLQERLRTDEPIRTTTVTVRCDR
jgi:hypothetical protein